MHGSLQAFARGPHHQNKLSIVSMTPSHYSLRLPSYRHSHCGRFHPYGKPARPSQGDVDLMQTIDLRYDAVPGRPSLTLSVVVEEDEEALTDITNALAEAERRTPSVTDRLRRNSFVELVVDLAFVMRRRLQRLRHP
ncbi:hypothetical protein B0H21DRAFT_133395 [Amylocystis lapponica]|nr:hypothetical protein B0H21DRAFT_133395 [Amylocystis lapponica]